MDLNSLEKQVDSNLTKFNKTKYKVLHLGRNNPIHEYMLGVTELESSFIENRPQGPSGRQANHEPAMSPWSKEG